MKVPSIIVIFTGCIFVNGTPIPRSDCSISQGSTTICNIPKFSRGLVVHDWRYKLITISIPKPTEIVKIALKTLDLSKTDEMRQAHTIVDGMAILLDKSMRQRLAAYSEEVYLTIEEQKSLISTRTKRSAWSVIAAFFRATLPQLGRSLATKGALKAMMKHSFMALVTSGITYGISQAQLPNVELIEEQIMLLKSGQKESTSVLSHLTLVNSMAIGDITEFSTSIRSAFLESRTGDSLTRTAYMLLREFLDDTYFSLDRLMSGHIPQFLMSPGTQKEWITTSTQTFGLIESISPHFKVKVLLIDDEKFNIYLSVRIPVFSGVQRKVFGEWDPKILHNRTCYTTPHSSWILSLNPDHDSRGITEVDVFDRRSCEMSGVPVCESEGKIDWLNEMKVDRTCTEWMRGNSRRKRHFEDIAAPSQREIEIGEKIGKALLDKFNRSMVSNENALKLKPFLVPPIEHSLNDLVRRMQEKHDQIDELHKKIGSNSWGIICVWIVAGLSATVLISSITVYIVLKCIEIKRSKRAVRKFGVLYRSQRDQERK
ncbi:glycoprotein [Odonatan anphe-related virus OKIAV59]|uniref:Glycoprotein n=1 Tax=Odonatan anphe-related virus OKIAV59 TaxID=2746375 RepID=A0AAE7IFS9_9MONO|nr:glycoprotein [Odonatan anphe-related virus OKIAV59]QMP82150.1 glycoprotein [Odonatan anphe-related virus OKIAV59]